MDSIVSWEPSEDVDSLVKSILECKKELTKACFSMYGSARIKDFKVLASAKICKFLMISEMSKGLEQKITEEGVDWMTLISDFGVFNLFEYKHIDNETIRILATFEVGQDSTKLWYGNVIFGSEEEA